MIYNGLVDTISTDGRKASVYVPAQSELKTPLIPIAVHVGALQINDHVVVAFWSDNLADGAIIGRLTWR